MDPSIILGIESSCDESAAAVLRGREILSSVVMGQYGLHAAFGGVVPEIAARAHTERLDICVAQALEEADIALNQIDAIAVTAGPGLIGGVLSGVMLAKGLATALNRPLIGVNHLAGHALTPHLTDALTFPYLMLLISGGHCQYLIVESASQFTRLGGSIDDAPGEAFDKVARLLGLAQPGGPSVERAAQQGDPQRFALPRPLLDKPGCNLSFSGLKTAVMRARGSVMKDAGQLGVSDQQDLCASFQQAVTDILYKKSQRALALYLDRAPPFPAFAIAGGVAANTQIRTALQTLCAQAQMRFVAPPLSLCTDNAAMIAYAGGLRFAQGHRDDMSLVARPRWPLDSAAAPLVGSGRKGAKA